MCRPMVEVALLGMSITLSLLPLSCGDASADPPRGMWNAAFANPTNTRHHPRQRNHASPIYGGIGLERVPPSRPASMWDQPLLKPYFDNATKSRVIGAVGRTAFLHCRVKHLGDRAVTWIRKHDVHVLTVGLFTYTTDDRFTALHSEGSDDWTLRIASAQMTDSGTYECQISTEPKISKSFTLQIVESEANITGPREIHMVSGSNINLTCSVTKNPEASPQYIYWYRGTTLINYSSRGGISVVTDKNSGTSRLIVTRATTQDSGNYTCAPANAEPASVSVYILNGEHPAAMQGGESTSVHCQSLMSLLVLTYLILKFHLLTER